jgi:hypothetical protein
MGYSTGTESLFPNPLQKLQLFQRLITAAAFVTVVGIDLDLLFARPVIEGSIDS